MGTKTLTITEEAYTYLKSFKGEKSFSETILSLKPNTKSLLRFAGTLPTDIATTLSTVREDLRTTEQRL